MNVVVSRVVMVSLFKSYKSIETKRWMMMMIQSYEIYLIRDGL